MQATKVKPLVPPAECKVYTPRVLAEAIVKLLGTEKKMFWLEPSVGKGVFLEAMCNIGVSSERIVAIDLDQEPSPNDPLAKTKRGVDFLEWAQRTKVKFDYIVGNPPYISISQLNGPIRNAAIAIKGPAGLSVPPSANTWYSFVCASLNILKPGGALGFILPAAWDYADYARSLRKMVKDLFAELYVLRSRKPLFNSVQDGSVVVLGFGYRQGPCYIRRHEYEDLEALILGIRDLKATRRNGQIAKAPSLRSSPLKVWWFGEELQIRIGGVTGQSSYFLLTEKKRLELGLPITAVRPVVTKACHLTSGTITKREWQKLRRENQRIWLFTPPERLLSQPAVSAYLSLAPNDGGCYKSRYKIRSRNPWYRTPLPQSVDGFISGMSRHGPWISMRAMQGLNATNTLYTVRFRHQLSLEQKYAYALCLLTTPVRESLHIICRKYADGLEKFEPGDLLQIQAPIPLRYNGAKHIYEQAVQCLLRGKASEAYRIADSFVKYGAS